MTPDRYVIKRRGPVQTCMGLVSRIFKLGQKWPGPGQFSRPSADRRWPEPKPLSQARFVVREAVFRPAERLWRALGKTPRPDALCRGGAIHGAVRAQMG